MNAKHLIAIITLSVASSAVLAQVSSTPSKTRAEVLTELQDAQAKKLIANRNNYPIIPTQPSNKNRVQIAAETDHVPSLEISKLYSGV